MASKEKEKKKRKNGAKLTPGGGSSAPKGALLSGEYQELACYSKCMYHSAFIITFFPISNFKKINLYCRCFKVKYSFLILISFRMISSAFSILKIKRGCFFFSCLLITYLFLRHAGLTFLHCIMSVTILFMFKCFHLKSSQLKTVTVETELGLS